MSMIRNGTKIRNPISKARFSSDSMKAGAKVVTATWAGSMVGFCLAMSENSFKSAARTWVSMNFFIGTRAWVKPCSVVT